MFVMNNDIHHVTAIAVVDLARELKRHLIVDEEQLNALHPDLLGYVGMLERYQDVSELMSERLPEKLLLSLWKLASRADVHGDIGVRIGRTISPPALGLMSRMLSCCQTLGDALSVYLDNIGIVNSSETWLVQKLDGKRELVFSFPPHKNYPRCAVERSMISLHQLGEYYCQRNIPVLAVDMAFPKPEYQHSLEKSFGCKLNFQSDRNSLTVDESIFSFSLSERNRYMENLLRDKVSEIHAKNSLGSTALRVSETIKGNLSDFCCIESVADKLHMSKSTLYRKLRIEGTSFSYILDDERRAIYFKNSHLPVESLSMRLGFRDVSSFYKSRKKWLCREG